MCSHVALFRPPIPMAMPDYPDFLRGYFQQQISTAGAGRFSRLATELQRFDAGCPAA